MTTIDHIAQHFNFGRVMDPRELNMGPWLTTAYTASYYAAQAVMHEFGVNWRDVRIDEIAKRLDAGETFQINRSSGDTIYIGRLV